MYTTQGDYIERFMIMPPPDYPTIDNVLMVQPSDKECWWSIHREKSASEITINQKANEYCQEPGLGTVEMVYKKPIPPFLPVKDQKFPYTAPIIVPPSGPEFDVKIEDVTYKSLSLSLTGNRHGFSIYPVNNMLEKDKTYTVNGMQMKIFYIYKNTYFGKDVVAYDVISNKADLIQYTINKFSIPDCKLKECTTIPKPPPAPPAPPVEPPLVAPPPDACLEKDKDGIFCIKCNSGYKPNNDKCVTNDTEVNVWGTDVLWDNGGPPDWQIQDTNDYENDDEYYGVRN